MIQWNNRIALSLKKDIVSKLQPYHISFEEIDSEKFEKAFPKKFLEMRKQKEIFEKMKSPR